ncbi:FAD-binding protein [Umezawaea beigongshangensis]|uniref:FAD-binding protein n=1 Tax=Umezawaea beigongshangensis TaxID=2780383 RepID=UPI0027DE6777|nr:FAD-binding protein [Umezawaea beigongshangensis]
MRTNWAGNIGYGATEIHGPTSLDELRAVVARTAKLRAVGSGHSFNDLPDSPGALVELTGLPQVVDVDSAASTVHVAAGVRFGELARRIDAAGFALPALASLPHISVAGACATATHGSGPGHGNLATRVSRLDLVTADGDLLTLDRSDPRFDGVPAHLGALGVVTGLVLDLVPSFEMTQRVYDDLPLDVLHDHLVELLSCAHSVSLFTVWSEARVVQAWVKQRVDEPRNAVVEAPWFTAAPADGERHPVPGQPAESCTRQQGVPGPWFERLPHFRPDFTPSAGRELQSEYTVAVGDAVAALRAIDEIRADVHAVLQTSEIRLVAADELWVSPYHRRDGVSFHFTWIDDFAAVLPVVRLLEERLAPLRARPHWGKVFTTSADDLHSLFGRLSDFGALARDLDPAGKFGNAFTERTGLRD